MRSPTWSKRVTIRLALYLAKVKVYLESRKPLSYWQGSLKHTNRFWGKARVKMQSKLFLVAVRYQPCPHIDLLAFSLFFSFALTVLLFQGNPPHQINIRGRGLWFILIDVHPNLRLASAQHPAKSCYRKIQWSTTVFSAASLWQGKNEILNRPGCDDTARSRWS